MERTGDHFPVLKDGHQYEEERQRLHNQYEEYVYKPFSQKDKTGMTLPRLQPEKPAASEKPVTKEKLPVLLFFGHAQKQQTL